MSNCEFEKVNESVWRAKIPSDFTLLVKGSDGAQTVIYNIVDALLFNTNPVAASAPTVIPAPTATNTIVQIVPQPTIAPTPTPAPVSTPAPILKPAIVENYDLVNGVYVATPGWQSTNATLHYPFPQISYGSKVTIKFKRKANYQPDGNWKWLRAWKDTPGYKNNNFYIGQPYRNWVFLYSENLPVTPNTHPSIGSWTPPSNTWRSEEYQLQMPSGCGKMDGKLRFLIDGVQVFSFDAWQVDDANSPGCANYICVEDDPSNYIPPADSTVSVSDVSITVA